jgi:hypothetical protein
MPVKNFLPEGDLLPIKITIGRTIKNAIPATKNKAMLVSINSPVSKIYGADVNSASEKRKKQVKWAFAVDFF